MAMFRAQCLFLSKEIAQGQNRKEEKQPADRSLCYCPCLYFLTCVHATDRFLSSDVKDKGSRETFE